MTQNRKFSTAVVIGAGTMGRGIAQWMAQSNKQVQLVDEFPEVLSNAEESIMASWDKLASKGKFTADQIAEFKKSITFKASIEETDKSTDLVIEAVPEKLSIKDQVFEKCHLHFNQESIFATNTSSISIDKLCRNLGDQRKKQFLGLHFFNPATIMKLVELIPSIHTEEELINGLKSEFEQLGKVVAVCQNHPGFIVNRVARNFYGESLRIVNSDNPEKIKETDHILREVGGFKMGPFELMDLIGIDVNLSVTESVWEEYYQEPRFAPHPLQKRKVEANLLGRKTGRGFYEY